MHREIKAQYLFEKETSRIKYPQFQDGTFKSNFKLGLYDYMSLITSRSKFRPVTIMSMLTRIQPCCTALRWELCK